MLKLAKLLIYATAYFFVIYGGIFVVMPHELAAFVTGASPEPYSSTIDFRATYGGLQFGLGIILLLVMKLRDDVDLALLVVAITLLFMAVGRALGIVIDGKANLLMYVFLASELVFGVAALILQKQLASELTQSKELGS